MSMLDGVSQCWWLSQTCEINWDAWAAVGTVAAVFAAVLAPMIQRAFVRRKANALFALSYRADVINVQLRMEGIAKAYPMREQSGERYIVEVLLARAGPHRDDFLERARWLDVFSGRDVDLTKWPAVDLSLGAKLVVAIEAVRHYQLAANVLADPGPDRDWGKMLDTVAEDLDEAIAKVGTALDAIRRAVSALPEYKVK